MILTSSDATALHEQKVALREEMRAMRDGLDERAARMAARSFFLHASSLPWAKQATCVAAYEAFGKELSVRLLLEWWLSRGVRVLLPKVTGKGRMVFIECFAPLDAALFAGKWGLREPVGEPVPIERADLVLVPGTGFDHHGGRLGMGGGFYDRALWSRRLHPSPVRYVGVGYDFQLLDRHVPMAPFDQRLDAVCTPRTWVRCR